MRLHGVFLFLARAMALLGGVVLSALIVITVLSVLGRAGNGLMHALLEAGWLTRLAQRGLDAGLGPITGDFELVESGVAFAIFAFLPITQISAGHASVDLFTSLLPRGANRFLTALWEGIFALVMVVIALQLYQGMLGKMRYNETTYMLQYPVWWAYAASLGAAVVAALVTLYMALARLAELILGRALLPDAEGAGMRLADTGVTGAGGAGGLRDGQKTGGQGAGGGAAE